MKAIKKILLLMALAPMTACEKYLEEPNKLQTDIKTVDQLEALVNNAPLFMQESNLASAFATDDTEISREMYRAYPTAIALNYIFYYTWDTSNIINAGNDDMWTSEYKKIFTANVILANIDNVTGSDSQKNRIKADALFIRAMSNWLLVNHYGQPYAVSNLEGPGIPLKKSTNYTENISRATLKKTYEDILADVMAADALLTDGDVVANQRWRVTRPAINAFLSRYYLFTGNYENCIQAADRALISATAKLIDLNTINNGTPATYSNPAATLVYSEMNNWAANKFLYWGELYYTRYAYNITQNFLPSPSLLSLYDVANDVRYRLFMIPNGGRRFNIITPAQFRYTYFSDGQYLPSGPTVAEVLLNKAEAQARRGDAGGALSTVNLLRQKRLKTYQALAASSPGEALTKILQERRRELPFSYRWMDIRRFSVNDDPSDDVVINRDFFRVTTAGADLTTPQTYTLPVRSLRYALPINAIELANSQGQIQQNNY